MKRKNSGATICGCIELVLCVLLLVGSASFLAPCGIHEDGTYAACHWAGRAVTAMSCVLAIQALLSLVLPASGQRLGAAVSVLPAALMTVLIPGVIIGVCKAASMRCVMIMTPAVRVIGVLILILALIETLLLRIQLKKENNQ